MNSLMRFFVEADHEGSGRIKREQLETIFDKGETHAFLKTFGLDLAQAQGFFKLLDIDESGEVDIEEFVTGLMRLRGVAKGVDMASIMFENKRLFRHLADFMRHVDRNFERLLETVGA